MAFQIVECRIDHTGESHNVCFCRCDFYARVEVAVLASYPRNEQEGVDAAHALRQINEQPASVFVGHVDALPHNVAAFFGKLAQSVLSAASHSDVDALAPHYACHLKTDTRCGAYDYSIFHIHKHFK